MAAPGITASGAVAQADLAPEHALPAAGLTLRHMTRLRVRLVAAYDRLPIDVDLQV
jgi:hypothetical protein